MAGALRCERRGRTTVVRERPQAHPVGSGWARALSSRRHAGMSPMTAKAAGAISVRVRRLSSWQPPYSSPITRTDAGYLLASKIMEVRIRRRTAGPRPVVGVNAEPLVPLVGRECRRKPFGEGCRFAIAGRGNRGRYQRVRGD